VVESIATWYWLRDLLVLLGVDLKLGHSKYIKAISYAKVKTDAVDAHTLAQRFKGSRRRKPALRRGLHPSPNKERN
jgi:hypothetical protein